MVFLFHLIKGFKRNPKNGDYNQNQVPWKIPDVQTALLTPGPSKRSKLESPDGKSTIKSCWSISLECEVKQLHGLFYDKPSLEGMNRKLLEQKQFCDLQIEASDGTMVTCHKHLVAGKSILH